MYDGITVALGRVRKVRIISSVAAGNQPYAGAGVPHGVDFEYV